jgi:selenocysteine lyase/cysteine desulfurase
MEWSEVREREFSKLAPGWLNAAYFGPTPERALAAARAALDEQTDPRGLVYEQWRDRPDAIRELAARLTGSSSDDVAWLTSTTEIVNKIAQGLPLGKGDRVAVIEGDYPSLVLPWMLRERDGVLLDRLKPPSRPVEAAWLASELHPRTHVLSLSHVTFDVGDRVDLAAISELCRARGISFLVDATQSLGALTIDLAKLPGVSALAVSTYKWMLGPYGTGFAVVKKELREAMVPRWASWIQTTHARRADDLLRYTTDMLPGARGLDRGQGPAFVPVAMVRAALELFLELGAAKVAERACALADRLVRGLDREKWELVTPENARAAIVSVRARDPARGTRVGERLASAGISTSVREGKIRVSPHFYNDDGEVDRLLEVLAE